MTFLMGTSCWWHSKINFVVYQQILVILFFSSTNFIDATIFQQFVFNSIYITIFVLGDFLIALSSSFFNPFISGDNHGHNWPFTRFWIKGTCLLVIFNKTNLKYLHASSTELFVFLLINLSHTAFTIIITKTPFY